MNIDVFKEIYNHRNAYPLGVKRNHENFRDFKYINDELGRQAGNDYVFLLLTSGYFDKPYTKEILQKIGRDHRIEGIFKVGAIFSPLTNLNMHLYVLRGFDTHSDRIWFGELSESKKPFKRRKFDWREHKGVGIEFGEPEKYFLNYLDSVNLAISGDKKLDYINPNYRIFGSKTWGDRLNIEYYRPELIEAETKFAHEKTAKLGEIADIIHPREVQQDGKDIFTIKLSKVEYPLRPEALVEVRQNARVAAVKKGDIVTNKFLGSAYQNLTKRDDLVIANTQIIIRLKDKRFNRAYITTYLNSERMKAYFERRKRGEFIPMISKSDLADFEVVIPNQRTNDAAQSFLSSLEGHKSQEDKMKAINNFLFRSSPPPDKPLQNELLVELQEKLQATKNVQIRELFEVDLHEIEKCYKAGAYKACLALCGSLLEALVLDWISEVEHINYFDTDEITSLDNMINRLASAERITQHETQRAHEIRKRRNLIHPKNYIANTPLERSACEDVMRNLKPLIIKRFKQIVKQ